MKGFLRTSSPGSWSSTVFLFLVSLPRFAPPLTPSLTLAPRGAGRPALPVRGPGITVYLAWLLFSGLAWSINRFLTWVRHKTVNFDKRGRRGSWRNNKKNAGVKKSLYLHKTYLHSRKDQIFSPMLHAPLIFSTIKAHSWSPTPSSPPFYQS